MGKQRLRAREQRIQLPQGFVEIAPQFRGGLQLFSYGEGLGAEVPINGGSGPSLIAVGTGTKEQAGTFVGRGAATGTQVFQMPSTGLSTLLSATGEASALFIVRSAAGDGFGNRGPITIGNGGSNEHYPFTDNLIYIGAFGGDRWVNGVTPPVSITAPHAAFISHKSGEQTFHIAGKLLASDTRVETPGLGSDGTGPIGQNGAVYLVAVWNKVFPLATREMLSADPARMFSARRVWAPIVTAPPTYSGAVENSTSATSLSVPAGNFGVTGAAASSASATTLSTPAGVLAAQGTVSNSTSATTSSTPSGSLVLPSLITVLQGMADATWFKASINHHSDAWPPIADRTTAGSPVSVLGAWSSFGWDPVRSRLMFFGGGHGNYAGNEMYLWSAATRLWSIGALPSDLVPITLSPGNVCYMPKDGPQYGPPSMHTYDNTNYLTLADRYFVFNGPSYNYAGGPLMDDAGTIRVTGPYMWDPSKADPEKIGGSDGSGYQAWRSGGEMWQNRDSQSKFTVTWWFGTRGLNAVDGASATAVIGGKDHVIFGATDGSSGYLCRYVVEPNPVDDTVSIIGMVDSGAPSGGGYYGAGSYCASRNWFVALTTNATNPLVAWDCAAPNGFTNLSVNPAFPGGLAGFAPAGTDGIDYDPVLDRWFIWNGYGDVWMVAPPTSGGLAGNWTLTQVTVGSGIGAGLKPEYLNVSGGGVRGKWHYASDLRCMIAVEASTGDGNVWIWRPPGWTAPPSIINGNAAPSTSTTSTSAPAGTMTAYAGAVSNCATATASSTAAGAVGIVGTIAPSSTATSSSTPAGQFNLAPLVLNLNFELTAARRRLEIRAMNEITNPAFSTVAPKESVVLAFNFERLTSAPINPVVTCTRHAGEADATPAALIPGAPQISGSRILQRKALNTGVHGTDYLLTCQVDTAAGDRYILEGVLPVRA